jgi:hypothetical protein
MYTFPFSTCEKPRDHGVAQPYSFAVNLANCLVLFYFWTKARKHAAVLMGSLLAFEVFHTFSHAVHVPGEMQRTIIHALAYAINAALLYAFWAHTKVWPGPGFLAALAGVVVLDLYSYLTRPMIYSIGSQVILIFMIMGYYAPMLPKYVQLWPIVATAVFILLMVLNESLNCEKMLKVNPHIPYHAVLELAGLLYFFLLGRAFYRL